MKGKITRSYYTFRNTSFKSFRRVIIVSYVTACKSLVTVQMKQKVNLSYVVYKTHFTLGTTGDLRLHFR